MTTRGVLPIDTYHLVSYAVQVPCYICDGGNVFDAELCRHCQAPMALVQQTQGRKTQPLMVAALGSADAGKTVYLGMLMDILSSPNAELSIVSRGAFSLTLQQSTMSSLARCQFPGKTPNEPDRWNWVHCQLRAKRLKRPVELILPDVSGEAVLEEIDHPRSYPVIRSFLQKCGGVMLLIDADRLESGEREQDFVTMKIISYLCELDDDRKRGWGTRPFSFIFTKADQSELCFDDPTDYARQHTPGLWRLCQERLRSYRFFAAGIVGACVQRRELAGMARVPLRIEPRGVVEPFAWLTEQVAK